MSAKPFFDTNILIYAVVEGDLRAERARELLTDGGIVSVQVLNEFVAVARGKLKMTWPGVLEALEDFRILCPDPVPITLQLHGAALRISERYRYGFYDSLIVAAALKSSCATLYSEDMRTGEVIRSLTIRNPFSTEKDVISSKKKGQ